MNGLDPPDLALWGLHCFCIGARKTPHRAIAADNNGQILYLARNGVTRDQLVAAGVPCLDSQIALLQMMGVLNVDGRDLRTSIPMLGADMMLKLRSRCQLHSPPTAAALASPTQRIRHVLASTGAARNQYAIVFGHGLDGLMWEMLRQHDQLPTTELSVGRPYWNGLFWAIHPRRSGAAGTNEVTRGTTTLVTVWSEHLLEALQSLSTAWVRGEWSTGVPVIHMNADDSLHEACTDIARTSVNALRRLVDDLHADGFSDFTREQLLLIAGHEFIWELADHLIQRGLLIDPTAVCGGPADDANLKSLMYVRLRS